IVEWYDELVALTDSPLARLNRAVAVDEAEGPRAGLTGLAPLQQSLARYEAAAADLHDWAGEAEITARMHGQAARAATNQAEHDHLRRQAARLTTAARTE